MKLFQFLAIHSPVFAAMFYKNFAEKEKDEIEFKDVEYKVQGQHWK